MSIELKRTGRKVAFLDVGIGCVFFAHGQYWTRTDFDAGSVLSGSEDRVGSCCNFIIDGKMKPVRGPYSHAGETCEEVEAVDVIGNGET